MWRPVSENGRVQGARETARVYEKQGFVQGWIGYVQQDVHGREVIQRNEME